MTRTATTPALSIVVVVVEVEVEDLDFCPDCEESKAEGYSGCGECSAPDERWEVTTPGEVWEV